MCFNHFFWGEKEPFLNHPRYPSNFRRLIVMTAPLVRGWEACDFNMSLHFHVAWHQQWSVALQFQRPGIKKKKGGKIIVTSSSRQWEIKQKEWVYVILLHFLIISNGGYKWNWGNKPKKWRNHEEYCFVQMWGTVLWTNEHLFGELCNLLVQPGLRHFNTKTDVSLWLLYCYIIPLFILYLFYFPENWQTLQYWFGHVWETYLFPQTNDFDVDVPPVVFRRAFDNHSTWIQYNYHIFCYIQCSEKNAIELPYKVGPEPIVINRVLGPLEMAEPKLGFTGVISP